MEPKNCLRCKQQLPTSDFYRDRKQGDGLTTWCRACKFSYETERNKHPRVKAMRVRDTQRSRDKARAEDMRGFKMREMLVNARARAARAGREFNISEADFPHFRDPNYCCPVLGMLIVWDNKKKLNDDSPTIDRIDPGLGYVPGNVALISHRANTLKSDGTAEEHRLIAEFMSYGRP